MKAAILKGFGPHSTFVIKDTTTPKISARDVLVEVHASTVNPIDWKIHRAISYLPMNGGLITPIILGKDVAGVVTEKGAKVDQFEIGDAVYGVSMNPIKGTHAEFACVKADHLSRKPDNLTFQQAACIPMVGLAALQSLERAGIRSGSHVLLIGASGGVGTVAIQIAKSKGAKVTAVCSTKNIELVKELGADATIDYTRQGYRDQDEAFDIVFDIMGLESLSRCSSSLAKDGTYVSITPGVRTGPDLIRGGLLPGRKKSLLVFAQPNHQDLEKLTALVENDQLKPVVDSEYEFDDINEAYQRSKSKRAVGKIVLNIKDSLA